MDDLTWPGLLGRWVAMAQASAAWPREGEGGRWRASVGSIIALQAVACALGEIDTLPADERALGLDRSAETIRRHEGLLTALWGGDGLPTLVGELVSDAKAALAAARGRGGQGG
jgi:hypothetical protein